MIMGGTGEEMVLTHTKTLNFGILPLVTHPLPVMIVIIKNATPLRITANAPAHLILIIGIPIIIIMKDSIDQNAIRALAEVYCVTKVTNVSHFNLPMERRCRCSELLLIISRRNMTTTIIRGVHLTDVMAHHLDKME